jgi:DNA-binding transcriptional LysR family regulator
MTIKLEMLRCFVAVAECGNLTDAGIRLRRTPAALSMTLKQLEDHLDKSLFETDRKNKLSAVGSIAYELAQAELLQFDRTVQMIENFAQGGTGIVRVASVPSVAGTILPSVLAQFIAENPKVHIELRDMDSASVLRAMRQERIDIGIATVPDNLQGSECSPLFTDNFGLVCSHDHPLGQLTRPMNWDELEGETFIANELCGTIQSPIFQSFYRGANLKVHNIVSLLAMVKANLGVTVLPQTVLELHPGEIVFRPINDLQALRKIDLLHRASNIASPAAESMRQIILSVTTGIKRRNNKLLLM